MIGTIIPFGRDVFTGISTSWPGLLPYLIVDRFRLKPVELIIGNDLIRQTWWIDQVERVCKDEIRLAERTRGQLYSAAEQDRVIIAVDTEDQFTVVGCAILWQMSAVPENWHELGTIWVHPDYRFRRRGLPIADALCRRLLHNHQDANILLFPQLTTSCLARRLGMQSVRVDDISSSGLTYTLPDTRIWISFQTWVRVGKPFRPDIDPLS